jgi:hypothetical protein
MLHSVVITRPLHLVPRDLAFSDLLRLLQSHAPTYKIQAADLLLRPSGGNGRREGFVAYLSMANVTLAERLREGVRGSVFEGQRLSTSYTLGVPCADVYVDGVEELEEEEVAALMQRWGQVVRVTGVKGTPKGERGGGGREKNGAGYAGGWCCQAAGFMGGAFVCLSVVFRWCWPPCLLSMSDTSVTSGTP